MAAMPLHDYNRKRKFEKTPEPAPSVSDARATEPLVFCVQRHHARRLHYDLRLEVDGTLKSWAVPEGPTLDPAIKRLAVHVEDHPLLYADFEGNIPKGNYGAGSMMLWDRGRYEVLGDIPVEEQLARGDFKFRLHGQKLHGDFALVKLKNSVKGNDWLLIKKKDAAAQEGWDANHFGFSVLTGRTQEEIAMNAAPRTQAALEPVPMPVDVDPMLAVLSNGALPAGPGWIYEIKWDGMRALCFLDHRGTRISTRRGNWVERNWPELADLHTMVNAETAIIDGEIIAPDEKGRPSFERLQPRMMAMDVFAIERLTTERPIYYYAFDLLYLNGHDLRDLPLERRKTALQSILRPNRVVRYSESFEGNPKELLEAVRAQGLEGLIAKRRDSRYRPGRVSDWMKIKISREQDLVLCGWLDGQRDHFGSLVLGVYDDGALKWAGNVGTGFDQSLMRDIRKRLDGLATQRSPFIPAVNVGKGSHWVKPELVCSVKYLEWTEEGRLRAPVFVGLRPDKDPAECVRNPAQLETKARIDLLPPQKEEARVEIGGHIIKFTHLNKVMYPEEGYTKRDIINYYDAVSEFLIPHWQDRPLSLRRYVDGIGGEGFFQKNAATGFPEWMRTGKIIDVDHVEKIQVIGGGKAELLYLANLNCIDQNPWMSCVPTLDHPDFILIDLDPFECSYDKIVEAALFVRGKLELLELEGYPKTTGGDGMHIYVPLEPIYSYDQSKAIAEILARLISSERPDLFTVPRTVSRREKGKVYFDYLQNARGKTISAPYVLRAYPGAPVATPLEWRELVPGLDPRQFHLRNAVARFDRVGDLFAGVLQNRQRLEPAMERLQGLVEERTRGAG